MPTTAESVAIPGAVVIEAVAYMQAAADAMREGIGGPDADFIPAGHNIGLAAEDLYRSAFSSAEDDEQAYQTNPQRVELYARAAELTAELPEELLPPRSRADAYREQARAIRAEGTIDVPWPEPSGRRDMSDAEVRVRLECLEERIFGRRRDA